MQVIDQDALFAEQLRMDRTSVDPSSAWARSSVSRISANTAVKCSSAAVIARQVSGDSTRSNSFRSTRVRRSMNRVG